jgi:tetratricopeptide (TPR) repeat protein
MSSCHDNDTLPSPPLLTISEVVQRLNGQIHSSLSENCGERNDSRGGFELHTRLPDGSSRPATETELSTADYEMKLQQTVQIIQALPHKMAQLQWAEEQRTNVGNVSYQNQKYGEAMDVYLTLLAVAVGNEEMDVSIQQHQLILYTKLMNNLALCTLQLHRYQKAITFCTMALDHIQITTEKWSSSHDQNDGGRHNFYNPGFKDDNETVTNSNVLEQQRGKLLYRRAKSYRLKGEYDCAQRDLDALQEKLKFLRREECDDGQSKSVVEIDQWNTVVRKEVQLVQRAIAQEKLNCKRRKKAMRLLMTNDSQQEKDTNQAQTPQTARSTNSQLQPLYSDARQLHSASKRKYSTIRAIQTPSVPKTASTNTPKPMSSWEGRFDQVMVKYFIEFWCWLFHLVSSWCFNGRRNHS